MQLEFLSRAPVSFFFFFWFESTVRKDEVCQDYKGAHKTQSSWRTIREVAGCRKLLLPGKKYSGTEPPPQHVTFTLSFSGWIE